MNIPSFRRPGVSGRGGMPRPTAKPATSGRKRPRPSSGRGSGPPRSSSSASSPGDKEDIAGRPFVGPAGRVLDEALEAAGIDRDTVYVTNAVKHFKWRTGGK